jgi:hypothetical protein
MFLEDRQKKEKNATENWKSEKEKSSLHGECKKNEVKLLKRNQVKETFKGHVFEKNIQMSFTSKLGDFDLLFDRAYHN